MSRGEVYSSDDIEEDSLSGEDDDWKPEYGDWKGEDKDFTKKLNAARRGQHGGSNLQQHASHSAVASKSLQVSEKLQIGTTLQQNFTFK